MDQTDTIKAKSRATIVAVEPDFVSLEIESTGQKILWPRKDFDQNTKEHLQIGQCFLLTLKITPTELIQTILQKEKNHHSTNHHIIQTLEALIN